MNAFRDSWNDFKFYLSNNPNLLMWDINQWKQDSIFFKQFDDAIKQCLPILEVNGSQVTPFLRGTGVDENISLDNYSRMIPNPDYMKSPNRMSPPGEAYLYVTPNIKDDSFLQIKTITSELRAEPGQHYTLCSFNTDASKPIKLISLLGNPDLPVEEDELVKLLFSLSRNKDFTKKVTEIMIQLYFSFFNDDEIFKPIPKGTTNEDKDKEYRPFQAISKYFESLGYDGVIYKSTVCDKGINTVIFDSHKVVLNKDSLKRHTVL